MTSGVVAIGVVDMGIVSSLEGGVEVVFERFMERQEWRGSWSSVVMALEKEPNGSLEYQSIYKSSVYKSTVCDGRLEVKKLFIHRMD